MARFAQPTIPISFAMLLCCLLTSPVHSQAPRPGDPYQRTVTSASSPYWGYAYSPYGDAIRAQGDFLIKRQEAALVREQVRQTKLETRRQQLEHWEWERDFLVGAKTRERELARSRELEYSRTFPSFTEIITAKPLNNLLDELVTRQGLSTVDSTPVEPEWLAHVHITVNERGNVGLLKEDGLFWPQLLLRPEFAKEREKIEDLFIRAKQQVLYTQRDHQILRELRQRLAAAQDQIRRDTKNGDDISWSPRHFIEAKQFLRHLDDAVTVLEMKDAAFYLTPLKGANVAELVSNIKKSGIRFAPATVGCERFYVALHRALADEVTRLQGASMATKPAPAK